MKKFQFLEHTADMKFQAFGSSLEEAFENSALAMFNAMYDGKVKAKEKRKIEVSGKDKESLLYNFLEELLFLMDSEGFFLSSCKVKINEKNLALKAELQGDDAKNYKISLDVKAVTYNEMFVKREKIEKKEKTGKKDKFICQVVVDV